MATDRQQQQQQQREQKTSAASDQLRRASLRGAEDTIFDLVCARTTSRQWSKWLRAPLEHAAGAGNLDLVTRLQAAGAGGSALHVALRCGQEALARELLKEGACPNDKDDIGDTTPLHLAAAFCSGGIVSLLLRRGAPVDALDSKGRTALHLSAERGSLGPVQALLEAGADFALRCVDVEKSALDLAARNGHVEIAKALVEQGMDVNACDSNGCTALHAAAAKNRAGTVDALIKAGANTDVQGGEEDLRWTPLHMACEGGSLEAVMSLLNHGADVHRLGKTIRGGWGGRCSALFLAARRGSIAIVNALLASGARLNVRLRYSGDSALHVAASNGQVGVMKALIKHGSSIDATNYFGRTALFSAVGTPNNVVAIDALVEAGARVNGLVDHEGITPLHAAALEGCPNSTLSLLKHGAPVDVSNNEGETPLHAASSLGYPESISVLLKHGANINERTKEGRTPLSLVAEQDRCDAVKILLDAGADINIPADHGDESPAIILAAANDCADVIRLLAQRGADVNAANNGGVSALHRAAEHNNVLSVNALIAASANTELKDKHERTPLVVAFRSAFIRWKEEEDNAGAEEFAGMVALLKHGADANARDSEESGSWMMQPTSKTLLHYCACLGCPLSIVKALLDAGAGVDARDEKGCTPLHNAIEQGYLELFGTLLRHGADTDAQDSNGRTVLHKAAAAESNGVAYVDELISAGAAISIKDNQGRTPLHIAANNRRLKDMRALLRSGADLASVDDDGCTALHLAVTADNYGLKPADAVKAADLLLRWGADENAVDSSPPRRTPAQVWMEEAEEHNVRKADRVFARELLENAPRDRAWRRRGWLILCRAFPARVRLRADDSAETTAVVRSVRARFDAESGGGADSSPAEQAEASTESAATLGRGMFGGLNGLVAGVVGFHEEGVFRNVMEFV